VDVRRWWWTLALVVVASFAVLAGVGHRAVRQGPPFPARVVATDGRALFDGDAIRRGQSVWQSLGGQEVGSVFGHGAYVAPDWTADWLHRECVLVLDAWARAEGAASFEALAPERRAALVARAEDRFRRAALDADGTLRLDPARADAFDALAAHYADVFASGRDAYAIPRGALVDPARARDLATFFFWTSWAASTERPGTSVTYTQNWPHEPLVGNRPPPGALVWSVLSFVLLLAGVGLLALVFAVRGHGPPSTASLPERDPLLGYRPTPSQRATVKYFATVAALWVLQIAVGVVAAHYGVEGSGFYGLPIDRVLPYAVARTWHVELGVLWIATSFVATGLYVAPAVSGVEPRGQRLGVNVLYGALVVVVVGSLVGELFGICQRLGRAWFWLGAQGYEYLDMGRAFQIALFAGLCFWLWLVVRALWPALARDDDERPLLVLLLVASAAIPLFYAAGLAYGEHSPLVVAEYWRWWVVHLWVEGFFEVFATVVVAFLFTRLGLLSAPAATRAVLSSTTIFLAGGILGTFHHLYFAGVPGVVLALGAVFSALEVVPLVLIAFEAWENVTLSRASRRAPWVSAYAWPIRFFLAVAFWNFLGAGLFGFFINPPIALYYLQGLQTTPVHGHTALFGVYGMLGLGLMLFCLRALRPGRPWRTRPLAVAFTCINVGLLAMVFASLLPLGLVQGYAAVERGTWWARSAELLQTPRMAALRWARVPGDTLFAFGAVVLGLFVLGLWVGFSYDDGSRRHLPPGAMDLEDDAEAEAAEE
jgi:nitric oxide reductase subunit B